MIRRVVLVLALCVASACQADDRQPPSLAAVRVTASRAAMPAAPPDSTYDIAVQLRRFRDSIGVHPAGLAGAARSRAELVRRFVRAVEAADTGALRDMQLSAGEFAYSYYPDSKLSRPPYELEPQLMWQQIEAHGGRGRARLLRRYGGKPLGFRSLDCLPPERQGESVLHECRVRHGDAVAGHDVDERLFGTILERRGRFKFVSYANKL